MHYAGVKLHLQVAHIFGTLGIHYITFFQSVLSLVPSEALNLLLGIAALYLPLAGTGRALNRLAWTIGVLSLPITVAYALMATLYKFHFKGTIKTWMAMRGKATLPFLPQPIAPQTASSDGTLSPRTRRDFPLTNPIHLAVAALLFMPFLLTFPTTAWYYAYVCVLHLGCSLLVEGVDALGAGRVAVFRQISVLEVARKCAKGDILGLDRWATVFVPAMKQHQA